MLKLDFCLKRVLTV